MENCGIYEIDTRLLSSLTVRPEEIRALELPAGRVLYCKGEALSYGYDAVLIVDRFAADDGRLACTMVRQVLPCNDGEWGQDHILPHKAAREWARDSGAQRVTVPGGIAPLTLEGWVAVPDFAMSGTSWYIVREEALVQWDDVRYDGR